MVTGVVEWLRVMAGVVSVVMVRVDVGCGDVGGRGDVGVGPRVASVGVVIVMGDGVIVVMCGGYGYAGEVGVDDGVVCVGCAVDCVRCVVYVCDGVGVVGVVVDGVEPRCTGMSWCWYCWWCYCVYVWCRWGWC